MSKHEGVVAVVGCMRNGTSLVSQMIGQTFVYFGAENELIDGGLKDPNGIWENKLFQDTNKQILNANNGNFVHLKMIRDFASLSWDDRALIEKNKKNFPFVWEVLNHLSVSNDKQESPMKWIGWKDPRNSLTLPYWKRAIHEGIMKKRLQSSHQISKVIWCVRHPQEAAKSMASLGYGKVNNQHYFFHLWHLYNQAIMDTLSKQKTDFLVVRHQELMMNPDEEIERIIKFFDLDGKKGVKKYRETMSSVIDPSLHRFKVEEYDRQSELFNEIIKLKEAQ